MNFPEGQHPNFLVAENSKLYYIVNNSVYSMATNATALPTKADYITGADSVYGFYVKGDTFYVLDAKDYNSNGRLLIQNAQGGLKNPAITTGVSPNSVYIK